MKNAFFLILGIVVILGSLFIFLNKRVGERSKFTQVNLGGTAISVEISDTPASRTQGLSGRESLPEGTGMLFIFETPSQYGFWMKDMYFPIDIVWLDENREVVGVERNLSPETFPQVFVPIKPIKYALELPAGFSNSHSIDTGMIMYFGE